MINWKLRFKNGTTLASIVTLAISIVYYILDLLKIIPPFEQESIVKLAMMIIDFLALIGVFVDPTTAGISDSNRAMTYEKPYEDKEQM